MMIKSASVKAYLRLSWKWCGSPGGSVPRPEPFMYAGTFRALTKSMAASVARHVQTWLPSRMHGFSECASRSASRSMASGSPCWRVEAR